MSTKSLLLPLVLILLPLGACELFENKVSKEKLEAELATWLTSNNLTASEIVCPDNQKMEKGNVFECNCKIDGIDVPVHVEVTDPLAGVVEWETKYITVAHTHIETAIPALPELAGRKVRLDCPDKLLVSAPGSEWKCDAIDEATPDVPMVVTLKFTNGTGDYEWTLGPK